MARVGLLYPAAHALLSTSTRTVFPTSVTGLDNVPVEGPAILAPNHISFLDSVLLIARLPRRAVFVGKTEYLDSWKTRFLFPAIGMIPIDRGNARASLTALDRAAEVLEAGLLFVIFPEGTRSRSGLLHKGRTGVARLALSTGSPIIPVGIVGTDLAQPPGAALPRPFRRCEVHFGSPLAMGHYQGRRGADVYRSLTDELMFEIGQLSGQRYVDRYAERPAVPPLPADPEPETSSEPSADFSSGPRNAAQGWSPIATAAS